MSKSQQTMTVLAVAGRRIDPPTPPARFPEEMEETVRERLLTLLRRENVKTVVASGACGSDLLALDAARALGIRFRMVLPFERAKFREESVTDRGDAQKWGPLFDGLCADADRRGDLIILDDFRGEEPFVAATRRILEEARRLADQSGENGVFLAVPVWEGKSRGPDDYTEQFVKQAGDAGATVLSHVDTLRKD